MSAPTVPDQATNLEEHLAREVPCNTDAVGPFRGEEVEHGPARWLLWSAACPTIAHVAGSSPICDDCASWIRNFIAMAAPRRCGRCGRSGLPSEFLTLKEL